MFFMENPRINFETQLFERISCLMEHMADTGKAFYPLTEKKEIGGRITSEEFRIFLAYYKANIALYTLFESIPDMLNSDEDLRKLDLMARRNVQYLDQVIAYYMTGIEQEGGLD